MALEQLLTLAFALHLQPLPTLDYAAVPYSSSNYDADQDPASLRVGPNTKLDPIYDHHAPHSVDTLSFVLNYTQATDAIDPFAKLFAMLDHADESPDFRNLREFFDARYHPDGQLIGGEREPTPNRRIFRSGSRAASTAPPHRRGSQTTEGRKPSFAASLGGASALKLGWRRKNTDAQQQQQDGSDDEDSHSRISSSGHTNLPVPASAPYIRLLKDRFTQSPDHLASPRQASEYRPTKLVTFTVRLDLHSVGLAPPPPKAHVQRPQDLNALKRVGSGRSTSSHEWRWRRHHHQSQLLGGIALGPIASPESAASFNVTSPDMENPSHSGFSRLYEETFAASTPRTGSPAPVDNAGDSAESSAVPNKPGRKSSMISKLLGVGRRKSTADHSTEDSSAQLRPTNSVRQTSFNSASREDSSHANRNHHDEALDVDEEGDVTEQGSQQNKSGTGSVSRRRSSAGSASRQGPGNVRSAEPDLRSVQEDGMLDLHRSSSRSSVDTSLSGLGLRDEAPGTSADGVEGSRSRSRSNTIEEGNDFITLLREGANLCLLAASDRNAAPAEEGPGNNTEVTTPNQDHPPGPERSFRQSLDSPSIRTPRVYPKKSSVPSTPGKSIKSLDLDRSPAMMTHNNPIDASFKLGASLAEKRGEEGEAWWPCGDVDPLPVSVSSALGQAFGWEGIMHLCYGVGSRAAAQGDFVALGKAAALDQATKVQEKSVLDWRTGVAASAGPPGHSERGDPVVETGDEEVQRLAEALSLHTQASQPSLADRSATFDANGEKWQASTALFGKRVNKARTWKHWLMLMKSIKGWVDEYESVRVRTGLAREIGLDAQIVDVHKEASSASPEVDSVQVPFSVGSPQSNHVAVFQAPNSKVDAQTVSKVQSASRNIPHCVLADATNRRHGFRRRAGIPEGLALGPEDEETVDYSWSRKKLSVEHFATAMTIASDSTLHYISQLGTAEWVHRSAWELDYLEMCVFKTPLVAERFSPPGESVVPSSRSYYPAPGSLDRTKLCPNPDDKGAWDPDTWKRWLSTVKEGDIIVPAIGWQAWWTLISVLNGADRTGRSYDLQVKTDEEPFEALTDLNAVYL